MSFLEAEDGVNKTGGQGLLLSSSPSGFMSSVPSLRDVGAMAGPLFGWNPQPFAVNLVLRLR